MIRRHLMALRVALMVGDGLTSVLVFLAVSFIRFRDGDPLRFFLETGIDIRIAALLFATAWVSVLWLNGLYRLRTRWRLWSEARDIAKSTLVVAAITLSALFLFKQDSVSRLFIGLLFVAQPTVTLVSRGILRFAFAFIRRRGYDPRFMVIAGTGRLAEDFANRVESHPGLGIRIIGHLSVPGESVRAVRRPILGSIEAIESVFHSRIVDEVAICLPPEASEYIEPITGLASGEGKSVRIPADPIDEVMPSAHLEDFDGFVVRSLVNDGQREAALIAKRVLDVIGAAIGLVLLSPLLLATALWIRLRDGSPILFRQTRVGLHGRPFTIYKFRTMVTDAEQRLDEVMHLNERDGVAFKATNDPRITRIGRWLRKTSIDELPQLWNVLTGTMSLVVPRPPLPPEFADYDIWPRRRDSKKPGITGLWQVEARHEADFDRWVERDLVYIDGWSLWLDLKIILKTVPAMLAHGGR
jgi:exopolysaccharide biosynthesis polyprenyl glycosylphosphotransferase